MKMVGVMNRDGNGWRWLKGGCCYVLVFHPLDWSNGWDLEKEGEGDKWIRRGSRSPSNVQYKLRWPPNGSLSDY
jgi:hypothetical protein